MKFKAFSALAATAAILISQGAYAMDQADPSTAPQASEQSAGDSGASKLKEGASSVFSFGKNLFNKGVDAAKSGASAISDKAHGVSAPSQPEGEQGAAQAQAPASPSLAKQASDLSNSQAGKMAKQMLGGFVPGGAKTLELGSKVVDAKAKSEAKARADGQQAAQGAPAVAQSGPPDTVVSAVPSAIPGAGLIKTGMSFGSGLLDKLKTRRADSAPAPSNDSAPTP